MKILLHNKDGVIYVSVIFISLIIIVLLTSLMQILVSNNIAISSNNDSYRANYIVESILEFKIAEIIEMYDQGINNYLSELKIYKIEYIENYNNDLLISYNPPDFYNYSKVNILSNINKLGESTKNPFKEYEGEHYYNIKIISSDSNEQFIEIESAGGYNRARKFTNVKLELPTVIDCGVDEYGLPKIAISPIKVVQYYQTLGL